MAYTRVNWENYPSTNTPRNATNLNVMDAGVEDLDTRLTTAESDINTLETNQGTLASLNTTSKNNLVSAINEIEQVVNDNYNELAKNIKTLILIADQELVTDGNTTGIDLGDHIQIGNKLTTGTYVLTSGEVHGVKIGSGVNYVKASAQVGISNTSATDNSYNLYILRNGAIQSYSRTKINHGETATISSAEMLIPVSENDIICMQIYKIPQSNTATAQYQYSRTYLTVEVVA